MEGLHVFKFYCEARNGYEDDITIMVAARDLTAALALLTSDELNTLDGLTRVGTLDRVSQ